MTEKFNKEQVEAIVLQTIFRRPSIDCGGSVVYRVRGEVEMLVLRALKGCRSVSNLLELEDAVNSPDITSVLIDSYAAVTSRALKNVLERCVLKKKVFVEFDVF